MITNKDLTVTEGPVAQEIRRLLTESLSIERLEIEDDSARHAGHHHEGGIDGRAGGESHFNLVIVSPDFEGLSRLLRQRRVMQVLGELMRDRIHALSVRALTPTDA